MRVLGRFLGAFVVDESVRAEPDPVQILPRPQASAELPPGVPYAV